MADGRRIERRIGKVLLLAALLAVVIPPPPAAAAPRPYALDGARETALAAGGAALFLLGLAERNGLEPLTPAELAALDPGSLSALDRSATRRWSPAADRASDALVWSVSAAPVVLALAEDDPGRSRRIALMYGETMLLAGGATVLLKHVVARTRPYAYNDDPRIPDELRRDRSARTSFPSGHTAQAFAAMTFFATVHGRLHPDADAGWVWAGCLGAATATGVLRYVGGRHFPTDILAGAVLGAVSGLLVPALHGDDGGDAAPAVTLVTGAGPMAGPAAQPFRVGLGFAF